MPRHTFQKALPEKIQSMKDHGRGGGPAMAADEAIGERLPQGKSLVVQQLMAEMRIVAMLGDGMDDAPGLAAADAGIAMGADTDAATEEFALCIRQKLFCLC